MIVRKIKSAIKKIILNSTTFWNYLKNSLLEENLKLGKNIRIGKNVVIKTTDGGHVTIANNVVIENNCYIYAQFGDITIGKNGFIGCGSQIVAKNTIFIGDNSLISAYSIIRDANHGMQKGSPMNSQQHVVEQITIYEDVWLGSHSVVTAGCTIGKGSVVGANSVVTKDIEPYTIVGGVPAKPIKERTI